MEQNFEAAFRDLRASLVKIKAFWEWARLECEEGTDVSGMLVKGKKPLTDLKIEIGRFYLRYEDLKSIVDRGPARFQRKWREPLRNSWLEYFSLVRAHPEIFQ